MTTKIEIKKLSPVSNVCNQVLREAWKSKSISIAHVEMAPGNISLLHRHFAFTELYYILNGEGKLRIGGIEFKVEKDTMLEIPSGISHQLENSGESVLSHLVISTPPFNPRDVEVLDGK